MDYKKPLQAPRGMTNQQWCRERAAAIRLHNRPTQPVHWEALAGGLEMIANALDKLEQLAATSAAHKVALVIQFRDEGERQAIFSSPDTAKAWMDRFPEYQHVCLYPMVVDAPEFGDEAATTVKH